MSIPQHIIKDDGGTVSINLTSQPTTARVWVEMDDGTDVVTNAAGTISTIDTTLSSAATAGDRTVSVASATGISSGSTILLAAPKERVTCKSISGTTVTLWQPLQQDHASGTAAQGARVTYAVSASDADTLFWDGRVKWEIDGVVEFTAVECTLYPLHRRASLTDLADLDPMIVDILEAEADPEKLLDAAHGDVLSRIGSRGRVRVYPAGPEFNRAVALQCMSNYYGAQSSDSADRLYERYRDRATVELDRIMANIPRDEDQDGKANEPEERMNFRSVPVIRG